MSNENQYQKDLSRCYKISYKIKWEFPTFVSYGFINYMFRILTQIVTFDTSDLSHFRHFITVSVMPRQKDKKTKMQQDKKLQELRKCPIKSLNCRKCLLLEIRK